MQRNEFISSLQLQTQTFNEQDFSSLEDKVLRNLSNRLFDDFQVLDSGSKAFKTAIQEFKEIIEIISADTDNLSNSKLSGQVEVKIKNWILNSASMGYMNLFDGENIHPELIKVLHLEKVANKINPVALLCAYVGAYCQQITLQVSQFLINNQEAIGLTCNFINHNYGQWVTELIKQNNAVQDSFVNLNNIVNFEPIIKFAKSNETQYGLAIAGGIAVAAIAFFYLKPPVSNYTEQNTLRKK